MCFNAWTLDLLLLLPPHQSAAAAAGAPTDSDYVTVTCRQRTANQRPGSSLAVAIVCSRNAAHCQRWCLAAAAYVVGCKRWGAGQEVAIFRPMRLRVLGRRKLREGLEKRKRGGGRECSIDVPSPRSDPGCATERNCSLSLYTGLYSFMCCLSCWNK